MRFTVAARDPDSRARTAALETPHGTVATPCFMPVGTRAAVKSLAPQDLIAAGVEILLGNTYHLSLRPGEDRIAELGGLHRFMAWNRPILTDSGGFQVFSLARLRKVSDEGVEFQSHLDGATVFLTPERVVEIQRKLGSDIMMPLDEPAPYPCDRVDAEKALRRTQAWWTRSKDPALFAILQGSHFTELRERAVDAAAETDPPGYAIGGLSIGEPAELLYETIDATTERIPEDRPRYLMGAGTPADIVRSVMSGVDMFDCVLPTRCGRTGWAFTSQGMVKVKNASFARDTKPLDPACPCPCCATFTRAYLRHCFAVDEILGLRMVSLHNVHYYVNLMRRVRAAIPTGGLKTLLGEVEQTGPPLKGRR